MVIVPLVRFVLSRLDGEVIVSLSPELVPRVKVKLPVIAVVVTRLLAESIPEPQLDAQRVIVFPETFAILYVPFAVRAARVGDDQRLSDGEAEVGPAERVAGCRAPARSGRRSRRRG